MWDHYKKTFLPLQIGIWLAVCLLVLATRDPASGLAFLAILQVGSLLGAAWAARIRRLAESPARPRRPNGVEGEVR
jgi:hypothetical protein